MMADWNRRFYRYGKPGMPSLKLTPRRLALIAVIVFIAVAIALTLYWQRPPQQDYVTAPARPGDIENAVLATGRLDAVERVNVGARVSGEVKSLKVKLGIASPKDSRSPTSTICNSATICATPRRR